MNCFVASALNHKDVDAIFDHAIRPVLSEFDLRPLRVDRVEHNEDIDDQIFKLINKSQICIADLTYARPSVYYEAGFAFGSGKPVIYVVRRDHLRAKEEDPLGNLRVHFDLQMKNIIAWDKPNEAFKKQLRKRLHFILHPLLREFHKVKMQDEHRRLFGLMSQNARLAALLKKATDIVYARGYKRGIISNYGPWNRFHDRIQLQKIVRSTFYQVFILIQPVINMDPFRGLSFPMYNSAIGKVPPQINKIETVWIVISLRSVRPTTLLSYLPNWNPVTDYIFKKDKNNDIPNEIPNLATIAVIDGVNSVGEFSGRFRSVMEEIERGKP